MDRLAVLFARHRFLLACLVVGYTGLSIYGITRVTFDNDPLKLLTTDEFDFTRLVRDVAQLERMNLIVVEDDDLMTPRRIDLIRRVVERTAKVKGVTAVHSLLDARENRRVGRYLLPLFPSRDAPPERFEQARERVATHPLVLGHFLSADRKTSLVIVQFDSSIDSVAEVNDLFARLRRMLDGTVRGSGLRARITGMPAVEVEVVANMRRDIFLFGLLGAALGALISIWMFRSLGAAILANSGPVVGTVWTVGTLGLIGEPINMLTNVVPILVLVIGMADSLHMVLHVRRAVGRGESGLGAAQGAIRDLGVPCAMTSLSTAAGFGSLLVASLSGIRTFGWCCALGSVLSFLAVILVVPLLASTRLSRHVFVPDGPRHRRMEALADRLLSGILGYPRAVVACAVVLMLAMAVVSSRLEPDYRIASEIPHSSEAYRALEHVDESFGGAMFAYATVRWPDDRGPSSPEFYETRSKRCTGPSTKRTSLPIRCPSSTWSSRCPARAKPWRSGRRTSATSPASRSSG